MRSHFAKLVLITIAFLLGMFASAAFGSLRAQDVSPSSTPASTAPPPVHTPLAPPLGNLLFEHVPDAESEAF